MAMFYPPPPPFMGGRQPHAPSQLPAGLVAVSADQPPVTLGGPFALLAEVVQIAQPDPWTYSFMGRSQPFGARQLSPGVPGQSKDPPPFSHASRGARFAGLVAAWQPDPWIYAGLGARQAYMGRQISPGIPGQSINDPPHTLGGPIALRAEAVSIAQPDPWVYAFMGQLQPFGKRTLSPGVPGQSADSPPFTSGGPLAIKLQQAAFSSPDWNGTTWPYLFIGRTQPYAPRVVPPATAAVVANNPAFSHPARTAAMQAVIRSWDPPPYNFEMRMYSSGKFPMRARPTSRGYIIL
jgi:hypothetical protein